MSEIRDLKRLARRQKKIHDAREDVINSAKNWRKCLTQPFMMTPDDAAALLIKQIDVLAKLENLKKEEQVWPVFLCEKCRKP